MGEKKTNRGEKKRVRRTKLRGKEKGERGES